jgi:TRAP-type transport system periplasmic protein
MSRILSTKIFVAAGLAVYVAAGAIAPVAAKDLKMAFFASPKHPMWSKMMMPWSKAVSGQEASLKFLGFPGSQIGGSPPGAFKRVVNGIADVEFAMQGYTSTVFPKTMIVEIPKQWGSPSEATKALWKILPTYLANEYKRVEVLAMWVTDTPVLMTNKVVRVPSDLKGVKLRTPSRDQAEIIKGLGAIPVALPMPATYQAIEKGVVDGSLVGISVVRSFKLAEVVKNYLIDLPMGYSPQMIVMNKKVYAGLSAAQKKAIDANRGLVWSLRAAKLYENARKGGLKLVKARKDTNITKLTAAEKKLWDDRIGKIAGDWVTRFEKAGFKDYRKMLADYMSK